MYIIIFWQQTKITWQPNHIHTGDTSVLLVTLVCCSEFEHAKYITMYVGTNISAIFSSNPEANASELLEILEERDV